MTTAMQIGETARDRADFCRCFKTGAAVFLHDDGIDAHSTYRNTLRAAYMLARTNCDTRGCKPFGRWGRFFDALTVDLAYWTGNDPLGAHI
jgi:hypothetical protein